MRKTRREVTGKVWIVRMSPSVGGLEQDRRRGRGRSFTIAPSNQGRESTQGDASPSGDGRRFIVRADEQLTAFVELERQVLTSTYNPIAARRLITTMLNV